MTLFAEVFTAKHDTSMMLHVSTAKHDTSMMLHVSSRQLSTTLTRYETQQSQFLVMQSSQVKSLLNSILSGKSSCYVPQSGKITLLFNPAR